MSCQSRQRSAESYINAGRRLLAVPTFYLFNYSGSYPRPRVAGRLIPAERHIVQHTSIDMEANHESSCPF